MKKSLLNVIHTIFKIRFMESFLVSCLKNSASKKFLLKLAPPNTTYREADTRLCNRYGINYKLNLNDYQSWVLYFYSDSDSSFGCLKYIRQGDLVIDVGGNIGQTALMMAKAVGAKGKVISFEPFAETHDRFQKNLSINPNISNVRLEKLALGEKAAELEMYVENEKNSGGNRIKPQGEKTSSDIQKVTTVTLDEYYSKVGAGKISLIKIDVEGFEMKVLRGAQELIKKSKPDLFVEVNDANLRLQGDSLEIMFNFLKENGYRIFDPETSIELKDTNKIKCSDIYCTARSL
jgi:FkbM family methyltransferase